MSFSSIGHLNERVTVQAESRTEDGSGGYLIVWVDTVQLWAAVTPLGGTETQTAEQLSPRARYRFTVRSGQTITAAHRLVWRNAALNIRAITQNIGAGLLEITAEEGAPT